MSMKPVRWGILSTAKIAREKLIPALRESAHNEIVAIASRTPEAARAAAEKFGIPTAHGSYEALLADPDVEAIYNPLPNHLHVPLTLAAAQAGKHVLCEKPFAIHASELEVLRPFASKVHLREAFMVRHHPQWAAARAHVRAGEIGELRQVQVAFNYFNADPANIRNAADIGGGAMYDIGCYAITAGRWFFEADPMRVAAMIDTDPVFRTDRLTSALMDFGAGRQLSLGVSTQAARYQRVQLVGTLGRIEIEVPFNAPEGGTTRFFIQSSGSSELRSVTVAEANQYALQCDAFARAVRGEAPSAAALDESIVTLRAIEAVFASAKSGRVETL
ncbi:MAG TPA: Gfo/Idh/MocA family oxidoreductase [Burkholderiaceae bacterium]